MRSPASGGALLLAAPGRDRAAATRAEVARAEVARAGVRRTEDPPEGEHAAAEQDELEEEGEQRPHHHHGQALEDLGRLLDHGDAALRRGRGRPDGVSGARGGGRAGGAGLGRLWGRGTVMFLRQRQRSSSSTVRKIEKTAATGYQSDISPEVGPRSVRLAAALSRAVRLAEAESTTLSSCAVMSSLNQPLPGVPAARRPDWAMIFSNRVISAFTSLTS